MSLFDLFRRPGKIGPSENNQYVFVLAPPWSGSTVLARMVATSPDLSSFFDSDTEAGYRGEGQFLPGVREMMRTRPFMRDTEIDWHQVHRVFHNNWDLSKTFLLEKSPPNLIRAEQIAAVFAPVWFVSMVRNPYAHVEGIDRRTPRVLRSSAEQCLYYLQGQMVNACALEHNITVTYEAFTERPAEIANQIETFIPGIGPLDYESDFRARAVGDDMAVERSKARKLRNLNDEKIALLSRDDIEEVNRVLEQHLEIIEFFGYDLIEPTAEHQERHLAAVADKQFNRVREKEKIWPLLPREQIGSLTVPESSQLVL